MLHLRILGPAELFHADGTEISAVLTQPKRLALLSYLALENGAGRRRRDSLVSLFWPESREVQARAALRRALHFLRRHLGAEALDGFNDDRIGVDAGMVACDAWQFLQALQAQEDLRALALYRGELLAGIHVSGAAEFMHWLDFQRAEFKRQVTAAALRLSESGVAAGRMDQGIQMAYRARELQPESEGVLRWLLHALDAAGDRSSAIREYERFAMWLDAEFGVAPMVETEQLVERIARRAEPRPLTDTPTAPAAFGPKLGRIVEQAQDPIYWIGTDGRFAYANAAFCRVTGYAWPELQGMLATALVEPEWRRELRREVLRLVRGRQVSVHVEVPIRTRAGGELVLAQNLTLAVDEQDRFDGIFAVARDVTGRRSLAEALEDLSLIDSVTRLYNRRGFLLLAEERLKVGRRAGMQMALLLVDVAFPPTRTAEQARRDLFVLAAGIQTTLRESDLRGRIGNGRFAVMVLDGNPGRGAVVEERVRRSLDVLRSQGVDVAIRLVPLDPHAANVQVVLAQAEARREPGQPLDVTHFDASMLSPLGRPDL